MCICDYACACVASTYECTVCVCVCVRVPLLVPVKQVFSSMDFIGWYNLGDVPTEQDAFFHQHVSHVPLASIYLCEFVFVSDVDVSCVCMCVRVCVADVRELH